MHICGHTSQQFHVKGRKNLAKLKRLSFCIPVGLTATTAVTLVGSKLVSSSL